MGREDNGDIVKGNHPLALYVYTVGEGRGGFFVWLWGRRGETSKVTVDNDNGVNRGKVLSPYLL